MNKYWKSKKELAEIALSHTSKMEEIYKDEIEKKIAETVIFRGNPSSEKEIKIKTDSKKIKHHLITSENSVSLIFNKEFQNETKGKKIAILNFASFKNPGGKFLEGSSSQEEILCHNSYLYNVLKGHNTNYYIPNQRNTNKCMYKDIALYSKDILFINNLPSISVLNKYEKDKYSFDPVIVNVISCSPPNYAAGRKYHNISYFDNMQYCSNRIKFIKYICEKENIEVLVAGAFGCGSFRQPPKSVSFYFYETFMYQTKKLTDIYYPVPLRLNSYNAANFIKTFS